MAEHVELEAGMEPSGQVAAILGDIAERSCKLVKDFLNRQHDLEAPMPGFNGGMLAGGPFVAILTRLMRQPDELVQAQFGLWQDHARLWQAAAQRPLGVGGEPVIGARSGGRAAPRRRGGGGGGRVIVADSGDRGFKEAAGDENALFDFIKQSYLLSSKSPLRAAGQRDGLNDKAQQKLDFYPRQFVDMMAP